MYIYDRKLSGTPHQRGDQPITLRPSHRHYHPGSYRPLGEFGALQEANLNVTNGEFGRTLGRIGIPPAAVTLLRLSNKFMTMIKTLDQRYVSIWQPSNSVHRLLDTLDLSADGVVTKPPFKGRRVIEVKESSTGSMFEPYTLMDNRGYYDLIQIKKPDDADTGRWIEVIAHETGHAFNLVNRTAPPAGKMADRIRAAVSEEIATRNIEATVVAEVRRTAQGGRELQGFVPNNGGTDRHVVERAFFPTPLRRTYLEHFVLTELTREAIRREKLDHSQIAAKNQQVATLPMNAWRSRSFSSDYSKLRFWALVIDFRWRQLMKQRQPGTPGFEWTKEQVLQENANAFFGGIISYSARPALTPPGRAVQPTRQGSAPRVP